MCVCSSVCAFTWECMYAHVTILYSSVYVFVQLYRAFLYPNQGSKDMVLYAVDIVQYTVQISFTRPLYVNKNVCGFRAVARNKYHK